MSQVNSEIPAVSPHKRLRLSRSRVWCARFPRWPRDHQGVPSQILQQYPGPASHVDHERLALRQQPFSVFSPLLNLPGARP